MRKTMSGMCAALILLLPVAPLSAGKPKKPPKTSRTESRGYAGNGGVAVPVGQVSVCVQDQGCLSMPVQTGEEYVNIEITDASGTPTPFSLTVHGGTTIYCGKTGTPVWLNGADEIGVSILAASPDCAGVGTTGSVSATFSNRL